MDPTKGTLISMLHFIQGFIHKKAFFFLYFSHDNFNIFFLYFPLRLKFTLHSTKLYLLHVDLHLFHYKSV